MNKIIRQSVLNQIEYHKDILARDGFPAIVTIFTPDGEPFYMNFRVFDKPMPALDALPESCYGSTLSFEAVIEAVLAERAYQDIKWGADRPQSLIGFIAILESEIGEAKLGWMKNLTGRSAPLNEIVQVAAVAIACLQRYGVTGITQSANDIPI